jgi:predicted metalloprotease with PDZ domain
LLQDARKAAGEGHSAAPLTDAAFRDAIERATSATEPTTVAAAIRDGADVVLPEGTLGRCFRRGASEYLEFALGFDLDATLDAAARTVVGLDPKGPAAAAGLAEGDRIEEAVFRDGHAEEPVKLSVTRDGKTRAIQYLPRGVRRRAVAFSRVAGISDEGCGSVL